VGNDGARREEYIVRWSEVGAWTWGVSGEGRGVAAEESDMVADVGWLDGRFCA